ncbi:AraC family transcriptional regulator [Martelella mediterranea]|nr:AraC family transcriptional regulator [Martelella mediterranea]
MNANSGKGFERSGAILAKAKGGDLERSCRRDAIFAAPAEDGIERLEARFSGNGFAPHRHDTYALGLTMAGVQTFSYRGAARFSTPGRLIILHPDELHDGGAGGEDGLTYRMIYLPPEKIMAALEGLATALPFVRDPVADDGQMRASLIEALDELDGEMGELKRDGLIAEIAHHLLRLGDARGRAAKSIDRRALALCRDFLSECAEEAINSQRLEEIAGLDRFTLARQFRTLYGTSPHRYLVQRRLSRARAMIIAGAPLAEAATASGFADQSHMTRHFAKTYGMPPGRFRALTLAAHAEEEKHPASPRHCRGLRR